MIRHVSLRGLALAVLMTAGCVMPKVDWLPKPGGSPFGVKGFHALIVVEKTDGVIPLAQETLVGSTAAGSVKEYLDRKCEKVGSTPGWRYFDPAEIKDLSKDNPIYRAAVKYAEEKKLTPPYLIASDGKKTFAGPLPADTAAALAVLKPIGGP